MQAAIADSEQNKMNFGLEFYWNDLILIKLQILR